LSQKAARLIEARTENKFTEILLERDDPLLRDIRIQVRVYRQVPSLDEISVFSSAVSQLRSQFGVVIAPSSDSMDLNELSNLMLIDYDSVVKRAIDTKLIESANRLRLDADALANKQADILRQLHPLRLARFLPELSVGKVPDSIRDNTSSAWDTFEDLTFLILTSGFGLYGRREGHTKLFEHVPEGYFITGSPKRVAVMFDCKGSQSGKYKMNKDDELRFRDYINSRKKDIEILEHVELRSFVLFANEFGGDIESRTRNVLEDTGIHLCVAPVNDFATFCDEMYKRAIAYQEVIHLVQWPHLLTAEVLDSAEFSKELARLDNVAKRY
jgi:hypothetical protein